MSNPTVEMTQNRFETAIDTLTHNTHKIFVVGLGAFALVRENLNSLIENSESFATKLVEKGEAVEKDGRKAINEFVEPYQTEVRDRVEEAEKQFNELSGSVLNRLNIPSASNIDALNKKVAGLSRKVTQLKKEK